MSVGFALIIPAATLVRTRGALSVRVTNSGTADNGFAMVFGMYVCTVDAFNVGITALQKPLTAIENDWYVYEPFAFSTSLVGTQNTNALSSQEIRQFDSRGQRKLKAGDVLVAVIEGHQVSATTGSVIDVTCMWRSQFKL